METLDDSEPKPATSELCIHAPGHSRYLVDIRTRVATLARRIGFSEEEVAKIEMAVDEACANVIQHAYLPDTKWCWQNRAPEIRLTARVERHQLIIEINDHGQAFDVAANAPHGIDDRLQSMRTSGYGTFIIRRFMDEVVYRSCQVNGNTLQLIKYLPKPVLS